MSFTLRPRLPNFAAKILRVLVVVIAIFVVIGAALVSGSAINENIRFAKGTDQLLLIVVSAHKLAARDKNFATAPDEDLMGDLVRAGLIQTGNDTKPMSTTNPWQGFVKAVSPSPQTLRIETNVPGNACRRLALFFMKNGVDLGLTAVETRGAATQTWNRFYDADNAPPSADTKTVEDFCEKSDMVTLAFNYSMR